MKNVLRYGTDASLSLEVDSAALVAYCDAPHGEPLADVAAAVDRALAEPLGFPALARSVVPGDKVVLALDHGVPQAAVLVARAVAALVAAGIAAEDIRLLRARAETDEDELLAELPEQIRLAVASEVHDPARREGLS